MRLTFGIDMKTWHILTPSGWHDTCGELDRMSRCVILSVLIYELMREREKKKRTRDELPNIVNNIQSLWHFLSLFGLGVKKKLISYNFTWIRFVEGPYRIFQVPKKKKKKEGSFVN